MKSPATGLAAFLLPFVLFPLSPAHAMDARARASLLSLGAHERLEQACDVRVMEKIKADKTRHYLPDRAVADVTAHSKVRGNSIDAPGAAFRSRGQWYKLSFKCTTAGDHIKVLSATYKIGSKIPSRLWPRYGLWR
jgi:hypothetical protein